MEWSKLTGVARFLLGVFFSLAFATSIWAQSLNPGYQGGQLPLTEGQSLIQDDGDPSDPAGAEQEQPLSEVGEVEIDSDPDASKDANSIMDDSDNTGVLSPDEE